MSDGLTLEWRAPGAVAARFFADRRRNQAIMGPVGSAKTRTILTKLIMLAAEQTPSPLDGVRYSRWYVIRDTYRQLWRSVIPTWWKIMPPPDKNSPGNTWEGGRDGPAQHHLRFGLADRTVVDFDLRFAALGDFDIEEFMRGLEATGFYLNEMDTLAYEVWYYANGRVGRFPDMAQGGPTWAGIIGDLNAPDDENWVISMFRDLVTPSESLVEQQAEEAQQTLSREDFGFHVQPGGMIEVAKGDYAENPNAENLQNLPEGYYREQVKGQPRWQVRRMVLNKVGPTRSGRPVYEDEWNDDWHVAAEVLRPVEGLPLLIGADAGKTPAAIIAQRMPNGQWRILREVLGQGAAPVFGKLLLRVLAREFAGFEVARTCWADPASQHGGDQDEKAWMEIMEDATAMRWRPAAESNAITPRLAVVQHVLTDNCGPGVPALLLSPACRALRKGFNSGYQYARIKGPAGTRYGDEPAKNDYSHPHDALQYLLLGAGEYDAVSGRRRRRRENAGQRRQAVTEFNVLG